MFNQVFKFGIVGMICFIIDYSTLIFLKENINIDVLLASAISYSISILFNYFLCVKYVFNVSKKLYKIRKLAAFVIISIVGLAITQVIMWLGTDVIKLDYKMVKIIATGIVMCFNFINKKELLETIDFSNH